MNIKVCKRAYYAAKEMRNSTRRPYGSRNDNTAGNNRNSGGGIASLSGATEMQRRYIYIFRYIYIKEIIKDE